MFCSLMKLCNRLKIDLGVVLTLECSFNYLNFRNITPKHTCHWELVNNEWKSTHFQLTCQVSESTATAADWFNKIWSKFSPDTAVTDAKKGQWNVNTPRLGWGGHREPSGAAELKNTVRLMCHITKKKRKEKKSPSSWMQHWAVSLCSEHLPNPGNLSARTHTAKILKKRGVILWRLWDPHWLRFREVGKNFPNLYNRGFWNNIWIGADLFHYSALNL